MEPPNQIVKYLRLQYSAHKTKFSSHIKTSIKRCNKDNFSLARERIIHVDEKGQTKMTIFLALPYVRASSSHIRRKLSTNASFKTKVDSLARKATAGYFLRSEPLSTSSSKVMTLLHPPGACSAFTRSGSQYPPLGLLQLKALIGDPAKVDVLEADGNEWTNEETVNQLCQDAPQAIGMTVTCGTKRLTHAWSTIAKHLVVDYDPIVIVGGPAAAFETPSIFEECPYVDVVVKGEGEFAFPVIVDALETLKGASNREILSILSEIPSVNVRNFPQVNDSKIGTLPKEAFDTLPFPDLSASPVSRYKAPDAKRSPMVTMMTQRGCMFSCQFCNSPQIHGRLVRGWSNEQIIRELKHLKLTHGIREVSFVDDVFTNRRGGPRKLCELMIQEELNLTWNCNARADQITEKMSIAMKAAGCHQVFMGFESGCDDMLISIDKGETVADLERGAKLLQDVGINLSVGFIVGLPGESHESVEKTIELCNRVKPYRAQFTRYTPIPGSKLADLYGLDAGKSGFHDRSGRDQIEDWLKLCYDQCRYRPSL